MLLILNSKLISQQKLLRAISASPHITVRTSPERNMDASNTKKDLRSVANVLKHALHWKDYLRLVSVSKRRRRANKIHHKYSCFSNRRKRPVGYAVCSKERLDESVLISILKDEDQDL